MALKTRRLHGPRSHRSAPQCLQRGFLSTSRPLRFFNPEAMPEWNRLSDREVDIATGCALLIRTSAWRGLGRFDPRYWLYGEEAEMQLRMVRAGYRRPWFVSRAKFIHDNQANTSTELPIGQQVFRVSAILRARATLMRTEWKGVARLCAGPLLSLTAWRYGLMALGKGPKSELRKRLWETRQDWMAGYPNPDSASGAASRGHRLWRLMKGVLDPRAYIHALRIINFYNFAHVVQRRQIDLGDRVEITPNVTFFNGARISIGARSLLAARASLMAGGVHGRIDVGKDCLIGPDVLITAANYKGDALGQHRQSGMREANIVLEDNVWIDAGAVILPGVRIGRDAIVGAQAVVTKNVEAGAVLVGPAAKAN